ncbi:unnamed protein product [Gongylonema pulchrum]|uniref:WW domain-containing protein n=1 Tax=Gongylonema pulchrum TaxID=637853 RepID=A0A183E8E5_9BILA|nr:unnamed protein product [Gongylonema pulchrum]
MQANSVVRARSVRCGDVKRDRNSTTSSSTRLKEFGPWSEQHSSSGRRYFYNRETEVSQWEKPPEWREYERQLAENAANQSSNSSASGAAPSVGAVAAPQPSGPATAAGAVPGNSAGAQGKTKARERVEVVELAPKTKRPRTEAAEEDPVGPVVFSEEQHRRFLRADAQNATRHWPTEELEQSAMRAGAAAHYLTIQLINASCDIRSARSFLEAAETCSALAAQKLQSIAKYQKELASSMHL